MRIPFLVLAGLLLSFASSASAQEYLDALVRDFREVTPENSPKPGYHPDFNNGASSPDSMVCYDRTPMRGAFEPRIGNTTNVNPAGLAGLRAFEGDERTPILKPAFRNPPNCYRSRFEDWYTTKDAETNRAFFLRLPLTRNGNLLQYSSDSFFPLDDSKRSQLSPQVPTITQTFGHQQPGSNSQHNYGFTLEIHAKFTYKRGTGQIFTFQGDDDVLVYIDGRLVLDLGGIHGRMRSSVDLDTLGLVNDQVYPLDFFFAERHVNQSNLIITTSLELKTTEPPKPEPPPPPAPNKVTEGFLYDEDGDGIPDRADLKLEKADGPAPEKLRLQIGEQAAASPFLDSAAGGLVRYRKAAGADFFGSPVTAWDENAPENRGQTLSDPARGFGEATFPLRDRVGAVIVKATVKSLDSIATQTPITFLEVDFSEKVKPEDAQVLTFRDADKKNVTVQMDSLRPDGDSAGLSSRWRFYISPSSPVAPVRGFEVAVGGVDKVRDAAGNPVHPANPYKPLEVKGLDPRIGDIRAEKPVTEQAPDMRPLPVKNPIIVLESGPGSGVGGGNPTYTPLHPQEAPAGVFTDPARNPGLIVFTQEISHSGRIDFFIYDHLGQYVNRGSLKVTRQDLLASGKVGRNEKGYVLRYGWHPVSEEGRLVGSGVYIMRSTFHYGEDANDNVSRGRKEKTVRFGMLRPLRVVGAGAAP